MKKCRRFILFINECVSDRRYIKSEKNFFFFAILLFLCCCCFYSQIIYKVLSIGIKCSLLWLYMLVADYLALLVIFSFVFSFVHQKNLFVFNMNECLACYYVGFSGTIFFMLNFNYTSKLCISFTKKKIINH